MIQVGIHQYGLTRRPTVWRKSTHSASNGNCVEVAFDEANSLVDVRDSKDGPEAPALSFTHLEWDAFVAGVKDGQFDRPVAA